MSLIDPVSLPEGRLGRWSVKRFTVSEEDSKFSALRASIKGRGYVRSGTYTQLVCDGRGIIMSDTQDEQKDHYEAVRRATGHVLINGLGLGMVLAAVLKKPEVTKVTVVELDHDVVALIGPSYTDKRVQIVTASAYDYQPPKGERYGAVWHDIWDNIGADNLPQMTKLKRKYGRHADWQGCWCERQCRQAKKMIPRLSR